MAQHDIPQHIAYDLNLTVVHTTGAKLIRNYSSYRPNFRSVPVSGRFGNNFSFDVMGTAIEIASKTLSARDLSEPNRNRVGSGECLALSLTIEEK